MFENRLMRKVFGRSSVEVTGEWRGVLRSALLTKYYSGDQIEKNDMR